MLSRLYGKVGVIDLVLGGLGCCWAALEWSWVAFGLLSGGLELLFGWFWLLLGCSWVLLGALGVFLGCSWSAFGLLLDAFWGVLWRVVSDVDFDAFLNHA